MIGFKNSVGILCLAAAACNICNAQFPNQLPPDPTADLFLMAPRPLLRLLREGEIAIKEARYADGITALTMLLRDGGEELPEDFRGQDYFIEQGVRGLFNKSVKSEATRLLSELPLEGRRTLEIQSGVEAKRELDIALQSKDFEQLGNVARKYVHTEAGYDAQVLVAQYKLTGGHPLAAAGLLQNLLQYPAARDRYGPRLALATAQAWLLAGVKESASLTMKLASRNFPGQSIEIAGEQMPLDAKTDWLGVLARHADRDQSLLDVAASSTWLMAGGSPERNAVSKAGMPIATERWVREIHSSLPEQEAILQLTESEKQKGKVLLPKFELRMVGDLVLTKTTDASLLAIDFETGVIKWPMYFHSAPVQLTNTPFNRGLSDASLSDDLQTRLWGSSAFGKFSSDGQLLFLVSEKSDQLLNAESIYRPISQTADSNFLEGASIGAQGAVVWRVGGVNGVDEPLLAGGYFLGPPLPYQGELYSLVEMKGETILVVLEAASGRLQWKQQLIHSNSPMLRFDAERKSQALSPTISEGVILCPTGAGAIVAVDLQSRSLRWGATYATNRPTEQNLFRRGGAFMENGSFNPLERHWQEPSMIAQDGVVLVSPPESDEMFGRDILTGAPRLSPKRRNANRYVAGMRNGTIVLVGERQVQAIALESGNPVWQCDYPKGLTLAGKGVWQADSVLLPLTQRTVVRISTESGRLTDECQVALPLGNLFAYRDQLLSVSPSAVSVYYTRDSLKEQVARRLSDNPNDTWALNQQSQLSMANGDLPLALDALTRSFELDPNSADTRYLLVELLLTGLATDFKKYEPLAQNYSSIVEFGPQRFRFLQQLALGKIRAGQFQAAFESLLDLIPQNGGTFVTSQNRELELDLGGGYQVDSDAWISVELARAYEQASPQERQAMQARVSQELVSIDDTMVPIRREKMRFLQWLPAASSTLAELARSLLGGDDQTTGEHLLQPLLFSKSSETRSMALALLHQVALADRRLRVDRDLSGLSILDARNSIAGTAAQPADLVPVVTDTGTEEAGWNTGLARMSASDESRYNYGVTLDLVAERYGRPPVRVALSGPSVIIRHAHGDDRSHLDFPSASADVPADSLTRAEIRGGLLLLEKSSEIAAFDIHRDDASSLDPLLWRHSLLSPSASPTREFALPDVLTINGPFGIVVPKRKMPDNQQAIVGPLTPAGPVIQIGTEVILLDSLTGRKVWSRDGFDSRISLTGRGLEVAIVNPSLGAVQILDCRDGAQIRQVEYRGDWKNWYCHNGMLVEFQESSALPPQPSLLRVWDAMTGKEALNVELSASAQVDACEGRYLAIVEPDSKLHFCDLQDPDNFVYAVHEIKNALNIAAISVQNFEGRVIVLTNSNKSRQAGSDLLPVNGYVYAIDAATGELIWDQPGRLYEMQFPESQPRQSPFMVVYRVNSTSLTDHRGSLALIDLRTGQLAYSSRSLPLQTEQGFAMNLRPDQQLIDISLGARTFRIFVSDQPRPPQPRFKFGFEALPLPERPSKFQIRRP